MPYGTALMLDKKSGKCYNASVDFNAVLSLFEEGGAI